MQKVNHFLFLKRATVRLHVLYQQCCRHTNSLRQHQLIHLSLHTDAVSNEAAACAYLPFITAQASKIQPDSSYSPLHSHDCK